MKTVVKILPRARITVPLKWVDGTIRTESKICNTARSAAQFYAGEKCYNYNCCIVELTGIEYWQQTPAQQAAGDARYERMYRRALRVFKQYLP